MAASSEQVVDFIEKQDGAPDRRCHRIQEHIVLVYVL
jgi:hypothetical protein